MIPISYGKLDSKTYYSDPSRTEIVLYLACLENQSVILAHKNNINIIMPTVGVGEKIKYKNTRICEHVELRSRLPSLYYVLCDYRFLYCTHVHFAWYNRSVWKQHAVTGQYISGYLSTNNVHKHIYVSLLY